MSEETKLLPCPFCGDENPFVERMEISVFAVRCNSCMATGECGEDMDHDEAERYAIEKWNKRSDTNAVSTRSPDVADVIGEIDNLIIHKYQYNLVEYFGEGIKEDLTKIKKLLEVKGG